MQADRNGDLQDKLHVIQEEIRTLRRFCVNQGYSPLQIKQFAKPLLEVKKPLTPKKWLPSLLRLLAVATVFAALFYYDPAYRLACMYYRRASMQVLPYWDWTRLHNQDCLIDNPYYVGLELTQEDCELCDNLEEVYRGTADMDHHIVAEDYLKRDIPLIVTGAMHDWLASTSFNINFLGRLYEEEDALLDALPCMFTSNVRVKTGSARQLLRRGVKGEISNWYAHWENCEKKAAKVIRQFYTKPRFLPPMVEMAEPNWILVARDYKAKRPKLVDVAMPMVLYGQVRGEAKVELSPRKPCNETCAKLYATLHEGETLVLTDLMWELRYMPLGKPETIAIVAGGNFD